MAEFVERQRQHVGDSDQPALGEEQLLVGTEVGQVQQQCLVAPGADVAGGGSDLVGQILAASGGLRDLEQ